MFHSKNENSNSRNVDFLMNEDLMMSPNASKMHWQSPFTKIAGQVSSPPDSTMSLDLGALSRYPSANCSPDDSMKAMANNIDAAVATIENTDSNFDNAFSPSMFSPKVRKNKEMRSTYRNNTQQPFKMPIFPDVSSSNKQREEVNQSHPGQVPRHYSPSLDKTMVADASITVDNGLNTTVNIYNSQAIAAAYQYSGVKSSPPKDLAAADSHPMMELMNMSTISASSAVDTESHDSKIKCNCKKSKCLKLYCQCFAMMAYCESTCKCVECNNIAEFEHVRQDAIKDTKDRNANAFIIKVSDKVCACVSLCICVLMGALV